MPTFSIPALVWHLRQKISAISWAGLLALALFVSCAAVLIFLLRPQQQQISQLQQVLTQQATVAKKLSLPEQEPAQQLAAFYRFFPQQDSVPDKMARLYQAAAQNGLLLEQGEYHLVHAANSRLSHYEMVFPVKGEYPKIRQFVALAQAKVGWRRAKLSPTFQIGKNDRHQRSPRIQVLKFSLIYKIKKEVYFCFSCALA